MRVDNLLTPVRPLHVALLLVFYAVTAIPVAGHSFDIDTSPSPDASTSLICPNDNSSDCYPVLFQPTIHFEKIRPGQSLPPGLHVRLNIQTGEKEARLNIPEDTEDSAEAVVVIDAESDKVKTVALGIIDEEPPLQLRLQDAVEQEKHARPYTPPRPSPPSDPEEAILYDEAIFAVKRPSRDQVDVDVIHNSDIHDALETLTELAHSLHWGLTICRDAELIQTLLAFIGMIPVSGLKHINQEYFRSETLLLLATAVQNNQDALSALLGNTHDSDSGHGRLVGIVQSLALEEGGGDRAPNIAARAIFFLSQLCVSDEVLAAYLSDGAGRLAHLMHLFATSATENAPNQTKLRHRIANFVEDHAEQIATFSVSRLDREPGMEVDAFLRPWCDAFPITPHMDVFEMVGVPEAREEVSRVLKIYTGQGCVSGAALYEQQEL